MNLIHILLTASLVLINACGQRKSAPGIVNATGNPPPAIPELTDPSAVACSPDLGFIDDTVQKFDAQTSRWTDEMNIRTTTLDTCILQVEKSAASLEKFLVFFGEDKKIAMMFAIELKQLAVKLPLTEGMSIKSNQSTASDKREFQLSYRLGVLHYEERGFEIETGRSNIMMIDINATPDFSVIGQFSVNHTENLVVDSEIYHSRAALIAKPAKN